MCNVQFRRDLLDRAKQKLRNTLAVRYASLDEVVALCLRQIENCELSCAVVQERVEKLPVEPNARQQEIDRWVEEICRRAANSTYVRDCERIAQFLDPRTDRAEQDHILQQYWVDYAKWTYGPKERMEGDRPAGCLGARLIAYLGKEEAGTRLAEGQSKVDEKVFSVAGFAACAQKYKPEDGRTFEHFFKQWINWACGNVAREMRRSGRPGGNPVIGGMVDLADILAGIVPSEDAGEDDSPPCALTRFHEALEEYRRSREDQSKATVEVAAFELRYRAYLDPGSMTTATQELVKRHLSRLREEFLACQERLRALEEELRGADYDCDIAWEQAEERRRDLENQGCTMQEIDKLERVASERSKTEMENELHRLVREQRTAQEESRLRYMIAYKWLALARGRLELRRKEWERWAGCGKPWVRSQEEIGALLGIDQVTASRYIAAVRMFLEPRMREELKSCE